jgi:hypothetical protein
MKLASGIGVAPATPGAERAGKAIDPSQTLQTNSHAVPTRAVEFRIAFPFFR